MNIIVLDLSLYLNICIQNKRKIQEDIASKRLEVDKEKLKLQQLKVNFCTYELAKCINMMFH